MRIWSSVIRMVVISNKLIPSDIPNDVFCRGELKTMWKSKKRRIRWKTTTNWEDWRQLRTFLFVETEKSKSGLSHGSTEFVGFWPRWFVDYIHRTHGNLSRTKTMPNAIYNSHVVACERAGGSARSDAEAFDALNVSIFSKIKIKKSRSLKFHENKSFFFVFLILFCAIIYKITFNCFLFCFSL